MSEQQKHAGGRPPKFKTAEEMQTAIDAYFESCFQEVVVAYDEKKKPILQRKQIKPFTILGLALALDLTRQGLCEYAEKGEFSDTVKKAKLMVEKSVEEKLLSGEAATGCIFWLKNNSDYKDKQEHEHSGPGGGPIQYGPIERANRLMHLIQKAKERKETK